MPLPPPGPALLRNPAQGGFWAPRQISAFFNLESEHGARAAVDLGLWRCVLLLRKDKAKVVASLFETLG
jgi:hypothetical protein